MAQTTFFSVLKSNLKCAVCKNKECPVRFYPNRQIKRYAGGTRDIIRCEKDEKAYQDREMKRKLP